MGGVRRHLSFANVVSLIALFVALGGGAYAVQVAQKNSVTTKSIRNGTIRSVDIGRSQVRPSDLKPALLKDATTGSTNREVSLCEQDQDDFVTCVDETVTMSRAGRVFASADGTADSGSASTVAVITCRLTVDGQAFTNEFAISTEFSPGETFSFAAVTEILESGSHVVGFECRRNGTSPPPRIFLPSLTTVRLGP